MIEEQNIYSIQEKLRGCLVLGSIGDAIGSAYEGADGKTEAMFENNWEITDDTQLTLATCEAIYNKEKIAADVVAGNFLKWYNNHKLSGLGASTLKAMRELQVGGHWALVGRTGEFAAGNGAAMRVAPLAFKTNIELQTIRDICFITHKNDEAYIGALAIFYAIKKAIDNKWTGGTDLIGMFVDELPDTLVRDRLQELNFLKHLSITEVGARYRSSGYVVDSVPLSIFAAQKISTENIETIFKQLVSLVGDTDTICSMTGQIIGSLRGVSIISEEWMRKYYKLNIGDLINTIVMNWKE
jgi:ADP-ribosyl-[dinitrogen reductase] hydrolase